MTSDHRLITKNFMSIDSNTLSYIVQNFTASSTSWSKIIMYVAGSWVLDFKYSEFIGIQYRLVHG